VLKGLSPKDNREVPPLKYDYVYRLKRDFPGLRIVVSGGVNTVSRCSPQSPETHSGRSDFSTALCSAAWMVAAVGTYCIHQAIVVVGSLSPPIFGPLFLIPRRSNFMFMENPAKFNPLLAEFLA
jgi:hypothetical protein